MIDFSLTEEQKMLQQTARDFAQKEIEPLVEQIEKLDHAKQSPWELCRPMVKKGTALGFTKMLVPEQYGGLGQGCRDIIILLEELGAADVAIAADYFNLTMTMPLVFLYGCEGEQRTRYLEDFCNSEVTVLAGAQSEPNVAGSEMFCPIPDPNLGMKTFAERQGDGYVLNGTKSAFVTNAGAADAYFILARTDLTKPQFESASFFYIPSDTPGLNIGKQTPLMGYKSSCHAEVILDNVYVPKEHLMGEKNKGLALLAGIPHMVVGLAACYVGLARATYEYALAYSKERISWGQPIANHQAVALKLADMLVDTQAARLMVWDAAYAVDTESHLGGMIKAPGAKTFAVDTAIKNAQKAMEILGGYGVATEYKTVKFLSDAMVGYSCDFTRDILRLGIAHAAQEL